MELKIPPPIYMLIFAGLMWLLDEFFPIYHWPVNTEIFGICLIITGAAIDFSSLIGFLKSKTTINPMHPENAHSLVTSGMYHFSRNPMYLGLFFLLLGWSIYLGTLSPLLLLPVFIWVLTKMQIQPEEKILEGLFGESYVKYKQRVRRWI
jgi:protein-S-isoprenylcysteine O-methyltransferase Ste14